MGEKNRMSEESVSYCRLTYDDGSRLDFPVEAFDRIVHAMKNDISIRVLVERDITGELSACYVSKIQDLFISTPESRARTEELNDLLKIEQKPDWS